MMERIATIVPRALTALFLAVALSLPNYSAAFEAWRNQDDYLSSLYDQYLSEFGAQEAHAFAPVIALPAAIAAAGITPEMAGAACLAIFTAVTAISVSDVWDKMPTDQKARYDGSLANFGLGMGMVSGNYTFDPDDQNQPPEPKGPGGEKMNAAIIALCTGAGLVAVKDLADAAGYLIDFVTSPAGEDENGFPTGLGVLDFGDSVFKFKDIDLSLPPFVIGDVVPNRPGYLILGEYEIGSSKYYLCGDRDLRLFGSAETGYYLMPCSSRDDGTKTAHAAFDVSSGKMSTLYVDSSILRSMFEDGFAFGASCTVRIRDYSDDEVFGGKGLIIPLYDSSTGEFNPALGSLTDVSNVSNSAANVPDAVSDVLRDVAQAGVGTEAAQQIVNNYVTNNIANSEKVVTVPSDLADTGDYDKVVTDPAPSPDPGPDPDPDPDPGGDETTAQKAEKLAKLPVQQLFPFCLIYDIQLLVEHVAGGSAAYSDGSLLFEFDVGFGYFDSPLVIDLTDYKDMRGAFHMAFDVMLVVGLLYFSISLFLKARSD